MVKKILLLPLLLVALLTGCRPVSGKPGHDHVPSTSWSSNADNHWKECTVCGVHLEEAPHTFDDGVTTKEPTETESGNTRYTCTVCSYYYDVTIPPIGVDPLAQMNDLMSQHQSAFIDPYEVRDYLAANGHDVRATLSDGTKYGYSESHNKIVEYKNNAVTRPSECLGDTYFEYTFTTVNTFAGLVDLFESINNGSVSYSTIYLGSNITQLEDSPLAVYCSPNYLELDLNGHVISSPVEVEKDPKTEKWFTLQFVDITNTSKVYIHGGVIEANRKMKSDGVEDDACCLSLVAAKSFRLEDLSLLAKNGTQCIGDLSQYVPEFNNHNKKVYIKRVNMVAPLRAISIAGGEWIIKDIKDAKSINGMVVIDGGKVTIDDCVINASTCYLVGMNDFEQGFTNSDLNDLVVTKLNGISVEMTVPEVLKTHYGAVTFNDAVSICSRRFNSYRAANVTIKNSTLSPVVVNNTPVGYGVRFYDLDNNDDDSITPTLLNNTYPYENGSGFGGANC